ncbi:MULTISPECIES: hypothetical protein [unclassified Streptomyces]|uniref:Uncharacterized protein n=1 Tax=Streptomyces sp. NBC_00119 TaxID=2975659 RepID=A0AAU1UBS6_9ACTN|nr:MULTISPECIES: hypothetical protein [unclassified Streptomyces]MCX4644085.1 hypothetical protein [Streptomyces sp. NBC_01446]MCX5325197.1 hypothetical protein [Streptomyces sp. NBC_00120]
MRVLYLINIFNPDHLSADSRWIFADLLAPALVGAGAEVTVAEPAPVRAVASTRPGHRERSTGPVSVPTSTNWWR